VCGGIHGESACLETILQTTLRPPPAGRGAYGVRMHTATSKDGTTIAYDSQGSGATVILVAGALSARLSWSGPQLAELLAPRYLVLNYDRRGRGDSGDTQPYSVEREIDDIEALIEQAGAPAGLYGHSSGASLALEAARRLGGKVSKLAMYEAPYDDADDDRDAWRHYLQQLAALLGADRRGDAVALFMRFVGTPETEIEGMRRGPFWSSLEALAPTLAYDHAGVLGPDRSVPADRASQVTVPTLVMNGGAGAPFMDETARKLSQVMPRAEHRVLEGQTHALAAGAVAPILVEFFSG
jgi:pimeloyl-ACP methyl ester carboxylesterase